MRTGAKVQVVTGSSVSSSSGSLFSASVTVACPRGTLLTAGGFSAPTYGYITQNAQEIGPELTAFWRVQATAPQDTAPFTLQAYSVCLTLPQALLGTATSTPPTPTPTPTPSPTPT
jgi:hypothetical protein